MCSSKTLLCKVIPHMCQNTWKCGHIAARDNRPVSASCGLVCARNWCQLLVSTSGIGVSYFWYLQDQMTTPHRHSVGSSVFQSCSAGLLPALTCDTEDPGATCCQLSPHRLTAADFKVAISSRQGGIFRPSIMDGISLWHTLLTFEGIADEMLNLHFLIGSIQLKSL